ncbi:MAG: putative glycoside hydrolase [bacterium]|nr:putative glycoside hydrolase [bacterium]
MTNFFIAIFFTLVPHLVSAAPAPSQHVYPRVANLFYRWDIKSYEVSEFAKWDLLLVDMEVQTFTPESLRAIRQINPNIIILAYITSEEIRRDAGTLTGTLRQRLYQRIADYHWLYNTQGERVFWWPGTMMLNVTGQGGPIIARSWNDTLIDFVSSEVLSTGLWDGVFYDNVWDNVTWIGDKRIDLNRDGRAELFPQLNQQWRAGMTDLLVKSRARFGDRYLLFGNGGFAYYPYLNGVVFENFPRSHGWNETLGQYSFFLKRAVAPRYAVLNGNTDNHGRPNDDRAARSTIAASLLDDGYGSFDNGEQSHAEIWWEDVYATQLGSPLGKATNMQGTPQAIGSSGVFRRDFSGGFVVVNSTAQSRTVQVAEGGVERASSRPGEVRAVNEVTLPPFSGDIFTRRVETVRRAVLPNGNFVRIVNSQGREVTSGFFHFVANVEPRAPAWEGDVDADGVNDVITADRGRVIVRSSRNTVTFAPYSERYLGLVHFAVGDVTGDGTPEIVTGAGPGGGPHVRVFTLLGVPLGAGFMAYSPGFRGGVDVAIMDWNSDGTPDIITGAGPGGGPHVRVFTRRGELLSNGFMAFTNFRGGVHVAAGDVTGDGRDDIVVGAASVEPHVRVFTRDGVKVSDFFPFSPRGQGVAVSIADVQGDGTNEIIASSANLLR